jgi:hypothetical protein
VLAFLKHISAIDDSHHRFSKIHDSTAVLQVRELGGAGTTISFPIRVLPWQALQLSRLINSQNGNCPDIHRNPCFFNRIFVCALSFRR